MFLRCCAHGVVFYAQVVTRTDAFLIDMLHWARPIATVLAANDETNAEDGQRIGSPEFLNLTSLDIHLTDKEKAIDKFLSTLFNSENLTLVGFQFGAYLDCIVKAMRRILMGVWNISTWTGRELTCAHIVNKSQYQFWIYTCLSQCCPWSRLLYRTIPYQVLYCIMPNWSALCHLISHFWMRLSNPCKQNVCKFSILWAVCKSPGPPLATSLNIT